MEIGPHVVYSRLAAIARELSQRVARTSRSRTLTDGHRFAVALLTGEPRTAVQYQSDPGHSYLVRDSAAVLLDYFAFDLTDGDVVVVGDPYSGGSTPQTLTFAAPILHEGNLVLFPAVRAEMSDLAGAYPGGLHPTATETWQESIRVTPMRLYRHGVLQRDMLRFLLRNSRAEALVGSDIETIVAALSATGRQIRRLLAERGRAAVEDAVESAIGHGRRLALAGLARWNGVDRAVSLRLPTPPDGAATLAVRVRPGNDGLTADFSGTSRQVEAPFNMTPGHARGYVLVSAAAEFLDDMVLNEGVLDAVTVSAPAGSLLSPALPAPTGLSDLVTGHAIGRLVRTALAGDGAMRIDAPAPALVLYDRIGAEENPPYALDPGFATAPEGWGVSVLAGRRRLPSAEILETRDRLDVVRRELTDDGGIEAVVRNRRGAIQASVLVPEDEDGPSGGIALEHDGSRDALVSASGAAIPDGTTIRFRYPGPGTGEGR